MIAITVSCLFLIAPISVGRAQLAPWSEKGEKTIGLLYFSLQFYTMFTHRLTVTFINLKYSWTKIIEDLASYVRQGIEKTQETFKT